ncbi:MAG: ankyrin repeat domain-containing protein [Phycisphaerae bacterium]|nr:ankyrin repeat domain-containing protein [Phycisphaerae bacterium]
MRDLVLCGMAASLMVVLGSCRPKSDSATESVEPALPTVVQSAPPQEPVKPEAPPVQKTKPASQAFFDAALTGDIQTVESQLQDGVNPNAINANKQTALMLAAFNGHADIVELMITYGGDVNHVDINGRTALMFAASGPAEATVKLLLEKGAKVNIAESTEKWTALMFAAAEGQAANVKLLLEHGADWKLKDADSDMAADFAARNGHTEVVNMIAAFAKQATGS